MNHVREDESTFPILGDWVGLAITMPNNGHSAFSLIVHMMVRVTD